jgi:protein-disulfide isomerase
MKRFLPFVIIIAVALAAAGGGTALYRMKREPVLPPIPGESASMKPGAKPPHYKGAVKATVVLEEFADLQCPPCASISVLLKKLEQEYQGKLRIVFRQFPLAMHKHAAPAAQAAEAAAMQGRFWEMSELLFQKQNEWSKADNIQPLFDQYAQAAGLDMTKYKADLARPDALQSRIEADKARGTSMEVTATPTLFLNNQRVPQQSMSEPGIRGAIEAILAGKPPFGAP